MPVDPGARRAVVEAVDALRGEETALLARLVRHRSLLGEEQSCLSEIAAIWREAGLVPAPVPVDAAALADHPGFSPPLLPYAGRDNVVAVHRPSGPARGQSLMLQGHADVVPEGAAELWSSPPFEPAVRDGRMFGRGAGDMKAGLAAIAVAWRALRLAGLQPASELQFAAVIEEECTGNGALAVMQALPKPDACLIPEPGPGYPALYTAQVGVVWAWVTVTGRPTHVREMHAGVNAIDAAHVIAERFRAYEAAMNRAEHRHPAFAADNHPINVNLGTIEGGEWNSSVPTRARVGLRVGVMPGRSARAVVAEIEQVVAEAAADPRLRGAKVAVAFRGFVADGAIMPATQPISRAVAALHREVAGEELRAWAVPALTDARFYTNYQDTQATCYGPEANAIHGIDESVGLASLHDVTRVIALLIADWCGLERASAPGQ